MADPYSFHLHGYAAHAGLLHGKQSLLREKGFCVFWKLTEACGPCRRHARSAQQHGCSAGGWGTAIGLRRERQLYRQPVVTQAASAAAPPRVTALADIDLVPMLNTEVSPLCGPLAPLQKPE